MQQHSRVWTFLLHILSILVLAEAASAPDFAAPAAPTFPAAQTAPRAADRIIVKMKQTGLAPQAGAGRTAGLRVVRLSEGTDVDSAVAAYNQREDVEYAVPDYVLTPDAIPNDPQYNTQWGLGRVKAPEGWAVTTGSSTVTVCVVDSGVDATHPDLKPNMHPLVGWNAIDGSNNPVDELKHGTHVAGILGAASNNFAGVAGVAWHVQILACKFMDGRGYGLSSDAIACIQYCTAQPGVRVIQASWSGGDYSQGMRDAIADAGAKGILFVSSAGNKATDTDATPLYPPAYALPNQLVVASTGYTDQPSSFTNYGATSVHIAAPGEYILSTIPGGSTIYMSGTSMATPFVSGAAALLFSVAPGLTPEQARGALMSTASKPAGLAGKVLSGLLNLEAALAPYKPKSGGVKTPKKPPKKTVLPKSAFCKAHPSNCELVCNPKNVCQYVRKGAAAPAPAPVPSSPQQAQPRAGPARRLLRGGGAW